MATSLDMSLDDMIKNNRNSRGRGRGRSQGGGRGRGDGQRFSYGSGRGRGAGTFRGRGVGVPSRRPLGVSTRSSSYAIAKSFNKTKDIVWRQDLFEDSMVAAGLSVTESSTKLYISNLHYGVTKEDIQELFSEMGHLKHCAVHYDNNRRPTGSAEVIFTRRSEAVAALKRYNNVRLDGKPMKIEVIGADLGMAAPSAPRVSVVPGARGRGQREVVMMPGGSGFGRGAAGSSNFIPGWKRNNFAQRGGRGRGRGRNNFGRGRGRGYVRKGPVEKSAEQLDKELDSYHSGAMNVD
ncbi:THO complex subunit 4D [Oryza glaberrima]|uniref:THO complex subunit 4D n=1 Tax=Oryza glaberrima TaxID=4538 RepID=UPI00224C4416|nr:THO complex subunit 4D [Oryza glaberrima]XP_052158872.1 THO complex subunit 4D [Oryza glaberrima]